MLFRLAYLGVTNVFALRRLLPMSDRYKDAQIRAAAAGPCSCEPARTRVDTGRSAPLVTAEARPRALCLPIMSSAQVGADADRVGEVLVPAPVAGSCPAVQPVAR